jgi:hypothetical protein
MSGGAGVRAGLTYGFESLTPGGGVNSERHTGRCHVGGLSASNESEKGRRAGPGST